MNLIKTANRIINVDQVVLVERNGPQHITIHYTAPVPTLVPNVSYPMGNVPPVASGHMEDVISGDEADEIWNQLSKL